MTALEQKWLIRIILRDLKVGLGERAVFNAMHADANEYFNTCSDLLRVSIKLSDPYYRLPKQVRTSVLSFSVEASRTDKQIGRAHV